MQLPTPGFVGHPMFESLRRWMGMDDSPPEIPLEFTLAAWTPPDEEALRLFLGENARQVFKLT